MRRRCARCGFVGQPVPLHLFHPRTNLNESAVSARQKAANNAGIALPLPIKLIVKSGVGANPTPKFYGERDVAKRPRAEPGFTLPAHGRQIP
jgi:hypothetical protein